MEIKERILKLLHFHKNFVIIAVIQTIPLEIVKLDEKAVPELDKYRSTRNRKTKSHTRQPVQRKTLTLLCTPQILF